MVSVWLDRRKHGRKSRRKPVFPLLEGEFVKTRIYIDGYNFYYGCLRGTSLKWLDLLKLFKEHVLPSVYAEIDGQKIIPDLNDLSVKYFTAEILEKASKAADSLDCQKRYLSALANWSSDELEIIKGRYSLIEARAKQIDAKNPKLPPNKCVEVDIWKLEEKKSDVNLALHLLKDTLLDGVQHVVVVTNDTDIEPALSMVRQLTKAVVGLVVPTTDHTRNPNAELAEKAHWVRRHITFDELKGSQLPRVIPGPRRVSSKPESWYANPDLLAKALAIGTKDLGSKGKAFKWLCEPNAHYGSRAPIELIEEGGVAAETVLKFMESWAGHD